MGKRIPTAVKETIMQLRKEGKTIGFIKQETGVSVGRIHFLVKETPIVEEQPKEETVEKPNE